MDNPDEDAQAFKYEGRLFGKRPVSPDASTAKLTVMSFTSRSFTKDLFLHGAEFSGYKKSRGEWEGNSLPGCQ
jgi:hypothetical protein